MASSIAIGDIVRVIDGGPRLGHLGEVKELATVAKDVDGTTNHKRKVLVIVQNGAESFQISANGLKIVHKSAQPNHAMTVLFLIVGAVFAWLEVRFGLHLANGNKFSTLDAVYYGFMSYVGIMAVAAVPLLRPKRTMV